MSAADASKRGWGPSSKRGAFSLTFDNFGEAADLELGRFPEGQPIGQHFTAIEYLPKFLKLVEDVPVTYFIEAFNVAVYPQQLRSIRDAGQEVAMHAWRHENWGKQDAGRRKDILKRSLDAYASIGISPKGFRPPGGVMTDEAVQEFLDCGLTYCSPLGDAGATETKQGLAVFPFAWKHVDAYMLDPKLGALRTAFGDREAPIDRVQWQRVVDDAVSLALQGHHVTLIFHPVLFGRDAVMTETVQRLVAILKSERDLWVASCAEVADWLRGNQH